jgi:hypothetical protein
MLGQAADLAAADADDLSVTCGSSVLREELL